MAKDKGKTVLTLIFRPNPTFTTIFHKSLIVNTWLIFFGHYNLFATVSFLRSAL